jgi:hypothetical protein
MFTQKTVLVHRRRLPVSQATKTPTTTIPKMPTPLLLLHHSNSLPTRLVPKHAAASPLLLLLPPRNEDAANANPTFLVSAQQPQWNGTCRDTTVLCPFTLQFLRQSLRFYMLFGYNKGELLGLRMLCGPQTDLPRIVALVRKAFEFQKPMPFIAIHLYTRGGEPLPINLVVQYCAATNAADKAGVRLLSKSW